jgi:uncharacterized protein (TIGR03118 family)
MSTGTERRHRWLPEPRSKGSQRRSRPLTVEPLEGRCVFSAGYAQVNLASDVPGLARFTDPHLVNPWGVSFSPTGPFWFADNGTGVSDLRDGRGRPVPLVVHVPAADRAAGKPTGTVFNGGPEFIVSENGISAPSRFLFAGDDGTISGWSEVVDPSRAIMAVDNSASGALYTGLALAADATGRTFLYAANFGAGRIDVFDNDFKAVVHPGAFQDPDLPGGYVPFNIQAVNHLLFVTFAQQDGTRRDDVPGAGHGFIDVFDTAGELVRRFASRGALDSPWGLAVAPADFGPAGGALLVGNAGDGRINAYNAVTGAFLGPLADGRGANITVPRLWSVTFGNGHEAGSADTLFFTAGPNDEGHGLFGAIQAPQRRGADTAGSGTLDEHAPGEVDDYPLPPRAGPALQGDVPGSATGVLLPIKESSLVLIPTLSVVPEPQMEGGEVSQASPVLAPAPQEFPERPVVLAESKPVRPRAEHPAPRLIARRTANFLDGLLDVSPSEAGPRGLTSERPLQTRRGPIVACPTSDEFDTFESDRMLNEPVAGFVEDRSSTRGRPESPGSSVQAEEVRDWLTVQRHQELGDEPAPSQEGSESRGHDTITLGLSGLLIVVSVPAVIYGTRKPRPDNLPRP